MRAIVMTAAGGRVERREFLGERGRCRLARPQLAGVVHVDAGPSVFGWAGHRERQRGILDQAARHFDAGELRVAVGAEFPLAEAADAHRALEAGRVLGKAVLIM